MIRALLVDDHASFRQPLAFVLDQEADIKVVGEAASGAEARRLCRRVDVAVVDLLLPDGDGICLVRDLRAAAPHVGVLVLTASDNRPRAARAFEAGAAGVLHKSVPVERVIGAIRALHKGIPVHSPEERAEWNRIAADHDEDRTAQRAVQDLTPREQEVFRAMAHGLSNNEIARRLHIGSETARTHVANVRAKLGCTSRNQVSAFAFRHGLVDPD